MTMAMISAPCPNGCGHYLSLQGGRIVCTHPSCSNPEQVHDLLTRYRASEAGDTITFTKR